MVIYLSLYSFASILQAEPDSHFLRLPLNPSSPTSLCVEVRVSVFLLVHTFKRVRASVGVCVAILVSRVHESRPSASLHSFF